MSRPDGVERVAAPVLDMEAYREWRQERLRQEIPDHVAATGLAPIRIIGTIFYWTCPTCGGTASGQLADEPVSGWDNPRWVRSGDDAHLTLAPSLGCPRWRSGECSGHWWMRSGELVPA